MGFISKPTNFVNNTVGKLIKKALPGSKEAIDAQETAINNSIANGKTQDKLGYNVGKFAEGSMEYATVNKALEGTALANGLTKVLGEHGGNIALGTVADAALDTLPTEINNASNGMSGKDIAKDAALNLAGNTALNAGFEAIPVLGRIAGGKVKNAIADRIQNDTVKGLLNAGNASELASQPIRTALTRITHHRTQTR